MTKPRRGSSGEATSSFAIEAVLSLIFSAFVLALSYSISSVLTECLDLLTSRLAGRSLKDIMAVCMFKILWRLPTQVLELVNMHIKFLIFVPEVLLAVVTKDFFLINIDSIARNIDSFCSGFGAGKSENIEKTKRSRESYAQPEFVFSDDGCADLHDKSERFHRTQGNNCRKEESLMLLSWKVFEAVAFKLCSKLFKLMYLPKLWKLITNAFNDRNEITHEGNHQLFSDVIRPSGHRLRSANLINQSGFDDNNRYCRSLFTDSSDSDDSNPPYFPRNSRESDTRPEIWHGEDDFSYPSSPEQSSSDESTAIEVCDKSRFRGYRKGKTVAAKHTASSEFKRKNSSEHSLDFQQKAAPSLCRKCRAAVSPKAQINRGHVGKTQCDKQQLSRFKAGSKASFTPSKRSRYAKGDGNVLKVSNGLLMREGNYSEEI